MIFDYFIIVLQILLPKRFLTACAGFLANLTLFKNIFIKLFIKYYKVNMQEALEENPNNYACFNDFFIRKLKPHARILAKSTIISPVDGYISEIGFIKTQQILQAKKHFYTIQELLACDEYTSKQFENGAFTTLYLSPQDYHRVHMPISAKLKEMVYIPGKLFSVQPITTRMIPKLFAKNERLVVFFETELGAMAMILVGATIVGKIGVAWHGDIERSNKIKKYQYDSLGKDTELKQGAEMGYFKLGSTVILLFANSNKFNWHPNLMNGTKIRLGESLIQN